MVTKNFFSNEKYQHSSISIVFINGKKKIIFSWYYFLQNFAIFTDDDFEKIEKPMKNKLSLKVIGKIINPL